MNVKVLIAGSRLFDDEKLMEEQMYYLCKRIEHAGHTIEEVVTGGSKTWSKDKRKYVGADYLGEKWAKAHGKVVKIFPADWNKHGKSAGPLRNKDMAVYVGKNGYGITFWDGSSRGTKSMIDAATYIGMTVEVIRFLEILK